MEGSSWSQALTSKRELWGGGSILTLTLPRRLILGNSFPVDSASSSAKWWTSDVSGYRACTTLHTLPR